VLTGNKTHKAFAELHQLNFPLISDTHRKISNAFGVLWMWGIFPIARRVTFVVDGDGVVRNVIASEFNISRYVDEAIAILKSVR
jgi:thioredoxin-dependent peroxiredoxin